MPKDAQPTTQGKMLVDHIKQHPGPVQVTRSVYVNVPGKHFPQLTGAEQLLFYKGTAVESAEKHKFPRHLKAWGAEHSGPGIRFVCDSDALDDPDHKGFWTTLSLWNRWRHETFKDHPDDEIQFLDELPATAPTWSRSSRARASSRRRRAAPATSCFGA